MFINNFDPVAFNILSLEIRWYSLSYIFGIIFGLIYCKKKLIKDDLYLRLFDDYIFYLILGIILGAVALATINFFTQDLADFPVGMSSAVRKK